MVTSQEDREGELIYGVHPVLEALKAEPSLLKRIILAEGRHGTRLEILRQMAREKRIPVQIRPREVLDKIAGTEHHQGVIALQTGSPYLSWEEWLPGLRQYPAASLVLILDGIEDPHNLGSLVRSAEACQAAGIIIPKDRAVGVTPAVVKASAGAVAHIPVVRVTNLARALEDLKKEGFWIVGADPRGEKSLYEMKFDMKVGLVVGSEGKGIRPLILRKCDYVVSIPMKGKISSLNASVAGAVVLFEILRQQLASQSAFPKTI